MNFISLQEMISALEMQNAILGLFLLGAGLAFLLMGFRIFKVLVAISFAVVGFVLAASLSQSAAGQVAGGLVGAVVLAFVSTLAVKLSVALLTGGWSAVAVMALVCRMGLSGTPALVLGGVSLIVAVSLTFIMFEEIIATVTSFEGTLLFLAGLVVVMSQSPALWRLTRSLLTDNLLFLPFLVLAGTVTGCCFQLAELREKRSGSTG